MSVLRGGLLLLEMGTNPLPLPSDDGAVAAVFLRVSGVLLLLAAGALLVAVAAAAECLRACGDLLLLLRLLLLGGVLDPLAAGVLGDLSAVGRRPRVSLRSPVEVLDLPEVDLGRLNSSLVPALAVSSLALTSSFLSNPSAPLLLSTMS